MKFPFQFVAITLVLLYATPAAISAQSSTPGIDKILVFEPLVNIDTVGKQNKREFSPEVSKEVAGYVRQGLVAAIPQQVQQVPFNPDSVSTRSLFNEMIEIVKTVEALKRRTVTVALTPSMAYILEKHNCRYAMGTLVFGFTGLKGNFGKQVAKGVGVGILTGILTLGTVVVVPVPNKAYATIYSFALDKEKNEVVFYKRVHGDGVEPTKPEQLQKEIVNSFAPYFYPKSKRR